MALKTLRQFYEQRWGRPFTDKEWEALSAMDTISKDLAAHCVKVINEKTEAIPKDPMPYRAQWTLETLIDKLQAFV